MTQELDAAIDAAAKFNTLQTDEQIQNWIIEICCTVREARVLVDTAKTIADSNLWYRKLLLRYGAAKGALDSLIRIGKVSPSFYEICCARINSELELKAVDYYAR